MEFSSADGAARYTAITRAGSGLLVALDFDGTLAPIVSDPAAARAHERAGSVLAALAARVRRIAVITGRPVRQVLALGDLGAVGERVAAAGAELTVLGQYGNERWSSAEPRIASPEPPTGLAELTAELPALLARAGATDAHVEEKGLAVAVHTRRSADPEGSFARLSPILAAAARGRGLAVEPGRLVIEVRAPGMDKGRALRALVAESGAEAVFFAGDDLGDVPAFEAVRDLRAAGLPGFLVCSGSAEESALRPMSDLVVDGPAGVLEFLDGLAVDIAAGPGGG